MRLLIALMTVAAPAVVLAAAPPADGPTTEDTAAVDQPAPIGWSLTTWPNAVMLAQQTQAEGVNALDQTISCTPGDNQILFRRYHPGGLPRPEGSRRGCDTRCRAEITATEADGRTPAGFTETRLAWPQARALLRTEAARKRGPQTYPPTPPLSNLLPMFAKACRLFDPAPVQPAKPSAAKHLE